MPEFQVVADFYSSFYFITILHHRVNENTSPVTNYVPDKPVAVK